MDILDRLAAYRAAQDALSWQGTFSDYLEIVRARPTVAQTAHARIYNMIVAAGVEEDERGRKTYAFFANDLFGLDAALERLVEEYFHSAARRLEVRKRILLLMGPVSGGKSTIVTLLKRGLERYARTEEGAVYAIAGCPMHEEPLHLIPVELRPEVEAQLGVRIDGNLCPACRMRLSTDYGGQIERVPVCRVLLSEEERVGIGTFSPSDPKSQDIADLTGSIDFATITEFGSESDPRAYRFDGELNKANRGLMEFQEMLKCDEKFLWNLLSLTQEGNFKAGRFALISADEPCVARAQGTPADRSRQTAAAGTAPARAVGRCAQRNSASHRLPRRTGLPCAGQTQSNGSDPTARKELRSAALSAVRNPGDGCSTPRLDFTRSPASSTSPALRQTCPRVCPGAGITSMSPMCAPSSYVRSTRGRSTRISAPNTRRMPSPFFSPWINGTSSAGAHSVAPVCSTKALALPM
jgi:hypothetical protein